MRRSDCCYWSWGGGCRSRRWKDGRRAQLLWQVARARRRRHEARARASQGLPAAGEAIALAGPLAGTSGKENSPFESNSDVLGQRLSFCFRQEGRGEEAQEVDAGQDHRGLAES